MCCNKDHFWRKDRIFLLSQATFSQQPAFSTITVYYYIYG